MMVSPGTVLTPEDIMNGITAATTDLEHLAHLQISSRTAVARRARVRRRLRRTAAARARR
jgi:hypothetical protein